MGQRGHYLAGMMLRRHIPEPGERGGDISFCLVGVIAVVMLWCVREAYSQR